MEPLGPDRLPWLEAIAAAARRQMFGPTLRESVEASIELRRLLTGDEQRAEEARRFIASHKPPPGFEPAAPSLAAPPSASRPIRPAAMQGSLF